MALTTSTMIALGLAAASAGASAYNSRRVANQQDAAAAEGLRRQSANQRAISDSVNKTLAFAKQSSPDESRKTAESQYLNAVRAKLGQAGQGFKPLAGASKDFREEAAASELQAQDRAQQLGGLMARIDAPQLQRQAEAFRYGNLGMDIDAARSGIHGDEWLTRLRMSGITRNPWLDAFSAAAGGYASGMGGRG